MTRLCGLGVSLVCLALGTITAQGQNIIGLNFSGRQWSIGGNTPQALTASDTAGVAIQSNWNNVNPSGHDSGTQAQVSGPNAGVISDNSGAVTGLTLKYSAQGMWSVSQSVFSGNRQMMNGYSDVEGNDANIGIYAISNISYTLYDVYVYIAADGNGRTASVSLNGGAPYYLKSDANGFDYSTPLLKGLATSQTDATNAHYVYFHNVSGSGFEVDVHRFGGNVGVAGIQIVDTSGYPPSGTIQPPIERLYAGQTAQFRVVATGTAPFGYHWRTNGVYLSDGNVVTGATSNVLTLVNLPISYAANYDVVINNSYGAITTAVAQLNVIVPVANSYESTVLGNGPAAYYRLNEYDGDPSSTPNLAAFDYINANNGVYGVPTLNLADSIYGPQPTDGYPGFETGNGAAYFITPGYPSSQISVPSWNINTNSVTMIAWVNPSGVQAPNVGLIFNRGANVIGLDYTGSTDGSGNYTLGYTWNNDPATYFWDSGLVPPVNEWSMVALVITPVDATLYLANTNGILASVHNYPHVTQAFSGPITIGNDPAAVDGSRVFNGTLDEVSIFNKALTQDQVLALFTSASGISHFPPQIANQPSGQQPFAGQNARFSVGGVGTGPLSYQWQMWTNGAYANVSDGLRVSGSQSSTLVISNVNVSDPTNFVVVLANAYGSVTSSPVSLSVSVNSYANRVLSDGAVAYYALNETGNPAAGGSTAYDYVGGFNGIYGSHTSNGFNGVTGPLPADGFRQFPTNNWAVQIIPNDVNGHIVVSPWNLNTNSVTFTCWIRPSGVEPSWAGLVFSRGTDGTQAGLNFSGSLGPNGNRTLSYTWGNICCWDSQLAPPTNQWSFVALVVTPTNATVYLFNTDGTASATLANTHPILPFSGISGIGLDPFSPSGRNFDGTIDEVAVFNQALLPTQISELYQTGAQLASSWDGSHLNLSWTGGVLLQSTNLAGPWTTNAAASPLIVDPKAAGPQMFYRVATP